MTDYSKLPPHMRDTAKRYIERGVPGGSFFTAVVSNDLLGAFNRADKDNTAAMRDWCDFLYNDMPLGAHGSPEIVSAWIARGGALGREVAA